MKQAALALALALAPTVASAAPAVPDGQNWQLAGPGRVRPVLVDINVPDRVGDLELVEYRAFRPGGDDVAALYRSTDRQSLITLYLYRPTAADARNAVYMTDATIKARYNATPVVRSIVPFAGQAHGMYRRTYRDLQIGETVLGDKVAGPVVSALLVGQAGDWLVKLRVTGPLAQQARLEQAADALVAAIRLGDGLPVLSLKEDVVSNCPEAMGVADASARRADRSDDRAAAGLFVVKGIKAASAAETRAARNLCVMAEAVTGVGATVVFREVGAPARPQFVLFGDSGDGFLVTPGFRNDYLVIGQVGGTAALYGSFSRPPTARQFIALTSGGDAGWLGSPLAVARRGDKGVEVEIGQ